MTEAVSNPSGPFSAGSGRRNTRATVPTVVQLTSAFRPTRRTHGTSESPAPAGTKATGSVLRAAIVYNHNRLCKAAGTNGARHHAEFLPLLTGHAHFW